MTEFEREVTLAGNDPVALASAMSAFLRRLSLLDRSGAATLSGEAWLQYLDAKSASTDFTGGIGRVLADAPFRASASYDTSALIALLRRYTRKAVADA